MAQIFISSRGDRSLLPDYAWVHHQHSVLFIKRYGGKEKPDMLKNLEKLVEEYNTEQGDICAVFYAHEDENSSVVIQSPLMKRICAKIVQAEEILFVDSSGTMDALGCRVFVLLINCCAGGLPVAVILCSSEKEFVIQRALYMYKEKLLDEESFHGRGKRGPKIILTNDSDSERNSFAAAFPEAELLLCSFHVLQAIW